MLSEKLRQRRHDDLAMMRHSNIGMELIRDAEQLEAELAIKADYIERLETKLSIRKAKEE